jgi:formylglycine-generating enzyme required for sulfatase activity
MRDWVVRNAVVLTLAMLSLGSGGALSRGGSSHAAPPCACVGIPDADLVMTGSVAGSYSLGSVMTPDKVWKGGASGAVLMQHATAGEFNPIARQWTLVDNSCTVRFRAGVRYLVFARQVHAGLFEARHCSFTGIAADVADDIAVLDRLIPNLPAPLGRRVAIAGGEFVMGSDPADIDRMWAKFGWDPAEKAFTESEQPAHRVKVSSFEMDRHLVTIGEYRAYSETTRRPMPPAPEYPVTDAHPVVNVTWAEADAFCRTNGGRLPTEAEWEFAARGGARGRTGLDGAGRDTFVWGDELPRGAVANLADERFLEARYYPNPAFHIFTGYNDGIVAASPVTAFAPNALGLFDMAGNVLEWTGDFYDPAYYARSPAQDPRGPASGTLRVLRGGAFDTTPTITRIARRLGNDPALRHPEKGFRCVRAASNR